MAAQAAKTKAKDSINAGLNALGFAKPPAETRVVVAMCLVCVMVLPFPLILFHHCAFTEVPSKIIAINKMLFFIIKRL